MNNNSLNKKTMSIGLSFVIILTIILTSLFVIKPWEEETDENSKELTIKLYETNPSDINSRELISSDYVYTNYVDLYDYFSSKDTKWRVEYDNFGLIVSIEHIESGDGIYSDDDSWIMITSPTSEDCTNISPIEWANNNSCTKGVTENNGLEINNSIETYEFTLIN